MVPQTLELVMGGREGPEVARFFGEKTEKGSLSVTMIVGVRE